MCLLRRVGGALKNSFGSACAFQNEWKFRDIVFLEKLPLGSNQQTRPPLVAVESSYHCATFAKPLKTFFEPSKSFWSERNFTPKIVKQPIRQPLSWIALYNLRTILQLGVSWKVDAREAIERRHKCREWGRERPFLISSPRSPKYESLLAGYALYSLLYLRGGGDEERRRFFSLSSPLAPSPIVFCFVLGSAFARLNLLLYEQQKKQHTKKKTASLAGYIVLF